MANKRKVRIGFVGVGGMGQCAHLRNYVSNPDCEVVALAEIQEKRGRRVAQRYSIPHVYRDHEELLANEKLDGIVASQPYGRHGILLPELMKAGIPIFIEKPLSSTLQSGEKIARLLRKSKAWIMVGYHKRSDPASAYGREQVEKFKKSRELGKFKYVRILMPAGDWIAHGFWDFINENEATPPLEWEPAPTDMSRKSYDLYSGFVNYYIHQVNLMRFFLGEPYRCTYADPTGVLFVGESRSGIPCTIEMTPYATTLDWQESVLAAFEHGYVKVELPAPLAFNRPGRVEILKDPGKGAVPQTVIPQLPWDHAMRQQAANFIAAIRGERKPPCDAYEALEDLKVARQYLKLWKGV